MKHSDLAAQSNSPNVVNAGFVVVKPTRLSSRVYIAVREITSNSTVTDDQRALNIVINKLRREKSGLNATVFDKRLYMSGEQYFEQMKRLLPRANDPCSSLNKVSCSVLVVHNNWIVSKEAKIYRFREHLMWLYDGENHYYSSEKCKYLTYINPKPTASHDTFSLSDEKQLKNRQISALKTALSMGYLLKRVVILPRFYCDTNSVQCPLNSLINIRTFDLAFLNQYRESSFLQHPKVPNDVKQSLSEQRLWHTNRTFMSDKAQTITGNEILRFCAHIKDKVINVGILEGIRIIFSNNTSGTVFSETMSKAFRLSDYRQQKHAEYL